MGQNQEMTSTGKINQKSATMKDNCDPRTQTEKMIHNEELFLRIFKNVTVGIALEDCDGRFTLTNDSFDRLLGYDPGELVGVHCSAVIPPEDVVERDEWYRRFMDNSLSDQFYEKRCVRKDGRVIWAEINVSIIRNAADAALCFIVIARDITARVHMEEALRVSEKRFRRLAENAHDIIFSMALPSGRYEYINPAVTDICGFTPEELYNCSFHIRQIVHPDFNEYINQQWENLLLGRDVPPSYEFKIIHKNGSERWIHQRNVPIRNNEGSLIALEGIVTDITGQKLMEEALTKSEHRFKSLSEASLEAIVYIENGVIVDANQALNRLFGYEGEELRGKLATDFIVPERRPFTEEKMRTRTIGAYETFGLRKDGSTFPIEVNVREFEYSGKSLRVSAVRDLTERYKIEEQLKSYQKHLERLVQERTNELKESEEKFRKIFENAVVGMYQSTPEGRFLRVNRALAQMYDYKSPKEMMQSVTNIATEVYAYPERRNDFMALVERDGIVRNYEIQARTRGGLFKYMSVNAHAIKDAHGKTLYYEGIIEDITEKKIAIDKLVEQRDLALKLAQTDKLEDGLAVILQTAINESGMECGGVSLKNPGTSSFDLVFSIGLSDEFAEKIRYILPGTNNWNSMASGRVLHVCPSKEIAPLAYEEGYKRILIVPILLLEDVIGTLVVASRTMKNIPDQARIGVEYLAAEIGNIVARMQASQRLVEEIAIRKETEQALTVERRNLEETNTALKVLLKHREEDKKELGEKLIANTRNLILPFIHKLKTSRLDPFQKMAIDLIESNLEEIVSPFLNNLRAFSFTPRQLEVITLIRAGKTTKEIAHFLSVGKDAVDMQRLLIRKKLGINNKKTNLRSYLQSLT